MSNVEKFLIHGLKITNDELRKDVINLNSLVENLNSELSILKEKNNKLSVQNEKLTLQIKTFTMEKEKNEGYTMYNYLRSFIA
jgi:hypothetical protein